ncbi:MAG: hypothetical protein ACK56I_02655, partial [bacterium]
HRGRRARPQVVRRRGIPEVDAARGAARRAGQRRAVSRGQRGGRPATRARPHPRRDVPAARQPDGRALRRHGLRRHRCRDPVPEQGARQLVIARPGAQRGAVPCRPPRGPRGLRRQHAQLPGRLRRAGRHRRQRGRDR